MRVLRFIVDGQTISQDPACDFSGLVPGTEGYLRAEFQFSSDWEGSTRVASFFSSLGKEYKPQILEKGVSCVIPVEALAKSIFKVQVIGRKGDVKLRTNKVIVYQKGDKL